ncbi:MAG: hypothetical protein NT091_04645 [Candidatus Falkowbacteria bacterium]|nr:hypothetical protein [Candidatus Falkowbacteria bacterium]
MRNLSIGITNADLKKIQIGGEYVPKSKREDLVYAFASQNKGKIFIQVESKGEAWYINPSDAKRYYLGRPKDAYIIMRELSIGINNEDFIRL